MRERERRWRRVPLVAVGATLLGVLATAVAIAVLWPTAPEHLRTPVGFGADRVISKNQAVVEALAAFVVPAVTAAAAVALDRHAARLHEDLRGQARNAAIAFAVVTGLLSALLTLSGITYFSTSVGHVDRSPTGGTSAPATVATP